MFENQHHLFISLDPIASFMAYKLFMTNTERFLTLKRILIGKRETVLSSLAAINIKKNAFQEESDKVHTHLEKKK